MYSNRLPLWPDPAQMTEADPAKIIEHLALPEVSEAAERATRALRTFVQTAGAAGMVVTALQRAAIVNGTKSPNTQLPTGIRVLVSITVAMSPRHRDVVDVRVTSAFDPRSRFEQAPCIWLTQTRLRPCLNATVSSLTTTMSLER